MSKININDYEYRYPRELIVQWKETGVFPEELKTDNLAYMIRNDKHILISDSSKISFAFAKQLRDRYQKQIEALELNQELEVKIKEIDIHAKRLEKGIMLRYTCKVISWDNLNDVLLEQ